LQSCRRRWRIDSRAVSIRLVRHIWPSTRTRPASSHRGRTHPPGAASELESCYSGSASACSSGEAAQSIRLLRLWLARGRSTRGRSQPPPTVPASQPPWPANATTTTAPNSWLSALTAGTADRGAAPSHLERTLPLGGDVAVESIPRLPAVLVQSTLVTFRPARGARALRLGVGASGRRPCPACRTHLGHLLRGRTDQASRKSTFRQCARPSSRLQRLNHVRRAGVALATSAGPPVAARPAPQPTDRPRLSAARFTPQSGHQRRYVALSLGHINRAPASNASSR